MSDITSITSMIEAAVAARKGSLIALRGRIRELLAPVPVGVVLADEAGPVCTIIRACTGASQWANRRWEVTITGWAAITPGEGLICEVLDDDYWDGHNRHVRRNEPTCRYAHGEPRESLRWLSGSDTRALAARLPMAIARYMERCAEETAANHATLVA